MVEKGDQNGAIAAAALTLPMEWPPRKGACSMSQRLPGYLPGGIGVSCLILTFSGLRPLSGQRQRHDDWSRLLSCPGLPVVRQTEILECTSPGPQDLARAKMLSAVGFIFRDRMGQGVVLHGIDGGDPQILVSLDSDRCDEVIRKSIISIRQGALKPSTSELGSVLV